MNVADFAEAQLRYGFVQGDKIWNDADFGHSQSSTSLIEIIVVL